MITAFHRLAFQLAVQQIDGQQGPSIILHPLHAPARKNKFEFFLPRGLIPNELRWSWQGQKSVIRSKAKWWSSFETRMERKAAKVEGRQGNLQLGCRTALTFGYLCFFRSVFLKNIIFKHQMKLIDTAQYQ